jgi:hypothetical protein
MNERQNTAAPDERRWSIGGWLTLALSIGYLLGGVLYTLAAFQQPSDGWNASNDVTTGWVTRLNQGGANVLHLGDRILAIEGVDVDMSDPPRREPPPNWRIGATARYTIVRDDRTLNLDVPLVQIPAMGLPRFILLGVDGTSFAALLTLLSGLVIFLLRPGSVAARLLLLILTYFTGTAFIWLAMLTPALIAAKVLAAFGATARDETNLAQLTAEMLRVVDETMQPEFVGLWLKETQSAERRE